VSIDRDAARHELASHRIAHPDHQAVETGRIEAAGRRAPHQSRQTNRFTGTIQIAVGIQKCAAIFGHAERAWDAEAPWVEPPVGLQR
jgi:hypothetical protein